MCLLDHSPRLTFWQATPAQEKGRETAELPRENIVFARFSLLLFPRSDSFGTPPLPMVLRYQCWGIPDELCDVGRCSCPFPLPLKAYGTG